MSFGGGDHFAGTTGTNERSLSTTVAVVEIYRPWKAEQLPDNPETGLDLALPAWTRLPPTLPIARRSMLWSWRHKAPADKILAATTLLEKLEA